MQKNEQLTRSLGLGFAIVLVLGNVIGSGVFKKVAPMAAELHSAGWILLCWVLGGVITMFGAISNAEIASMLADTGGEYKYYKKIYNKFFSFIYGWANFAAIKTAAIAGVSYVFAESLHSLVNLPPVLASLESVNLFGIFYPFQGFNVKLAAIVLILFLTWFNSRGLKMGANLSTIILILVVGGILIIAYGGSTAADASLERAFSFSTNNGSTVTISAVFTAMLAAFWAYEGWNSIGFLGGEIKNAHKNLPYSLIIGLSVIILVYLIANIAYLAVMPIGQMEAVNAAGNQVAAIEVVKTFWGTAGVTFITVLILLSTFGCTHATVMSNARTSYAMASEGLFFKNMALVNKHHVPGNALWYQGVWACMLVLSGTFDQLTDMLIFAAFIFYGATTLGVFILRKKMPDAHRPYRVWGYPVIPAIFIIFCAFLIVNTIYARPREAGIGMTLILIGVPLYYWFQRTKNKEA
ncbi:MAG: amino acid permease [Chitinophagaceae bacterium]|nr:amino acid permease [Chitinophagaceae bacterium]